MDDGGEKDEYGLPVPSPYQGEDDFNALEYYTDEYSAARALDEAIEMRGYKSFAKRVEPEDLAENGARIGAKIGPAELWADFTYPSNDRKAGADREKIADGVREGDELAVFRCSTDVSPWGYVFVDSNGVRLPFEPYHDFDDLFLQRALDSMTLGQELVCVVLETSYHDGSGVPGDPDFTWRVYSCRVMVFKVG